MRLPARALGLAAGFALDALLGDPATHHPVAGFGAVARGLEQRWYADSRPRGAAYALTLVGVTSALGAAVDRLARRHPVAEVVVTAVATWSVLGGRSLRREATLVQHHLERGDLTGARRQVTHLVGRDPATLDADGVARATVESVAENTSDAVVAPLLWGAVGGVAGLTGYRAANTLDAMVGHRTARYRSFGWAAARLDDVVNLVPARFSALAVALTCSPTTGPGGPRQAVTTWRRDAARHPSPNAGPVEAAFAGALGATLGGVNVYEGRSEHRGALGTGQPAGVADIPRAVVLARRVQVAALIAACAASALRRPRR